MINAAATTPPTPKIWLFQANPTKYRILEALEEKDADYWNLNQHAAQVSVGDRVLIWVCGDAAGIYAVGTVTTIPTVMPDTPEGEPFWRPPSSGSQPRPRVLVRFDQKLLDQPLRKAFLQTDLVLAGLRVLHQPRATNFVVTQEQWEALQPWLQG